jgi:hypothetical protein
MRAQQPSALFLQYQLEREREKKVGVASLPTSGVS